MPDFGISNSGFKRKRLDQLLNELNSEVKLIFGENFNLSPESPDGQINGVIAESNANLWELAEESYNAFNPAAATGTTLSNLVKLNGITRLPATKSKVQLSISGTPGAIIPLGSFVSTSDTGNQFLTNTQIALDETGNGLVFATAVDAGYVQALAGTITRIDTPVAGWSSVINLTDATVGTLEETDSELRARRERSVAKEAQSVIDAIFASVADIDGVTQTTVLENDTDLIDSNGLPPHSFQVIVVGGSQEDIAQAIWLNKPAGIRSFGNVTELILDSQGISHNISFSRPTPVDIYVEVTLSIYSYYPANGDDLIKQNIVDYANGDFELDSGFFFSDDVIVSRLYTPINAVKGHDVISIKVDTVNPPVGTSNIDIASTEIANFLVENITVIT